MERHTQTEDRRRFLRNPKTVALIGAATLLVGGLIGWGIYHAEHQQQTPAAGHNDIATTVFWVGEPSDEESGYIPNNSSSWVENWQDEFGGVDDPSNRCNNLPCGFAPKENPFYFALPDDDLDPSCNTTPSQAAAPWFDKNNPPAHGNSIFKNQWIEVRFGDKTVYGQWEDVGPQNTNNTKYVFGTEPPGFAKSGLDLSPAMAGYIGLDGSGKTSWRFVDVSDVPDGPWRQTITTSLPDCAR